MGEEILPPIKGRVEALSRRMDELERRLKVLEQAATKPVSTAKELRSKSPSPTRKREPPNHNYLKKTIDDAKRRYEQEHQV